MLRFDSIPPAVRRLLDRLAPSPAIDAFTLAGGTSLALRFGHRLSVDLDYFTEQDFSPEVLHVALPLADATVVARTSGSLTLDAGGVKLDFLRHAYPLLAPVDSFDHVRLMSLPDVAAMKLNAIANRGSKKDFFDLCALVEVHSLAEMLGYFERKYRSADRFVILRSLAWFEDAEQEPDPISLSGLTWDQVKSRVTSLLRGVS